MESLGQYKLLQRIAIGGMAEIFLAEKPGPAGFSRRLAIKRILPHRADDSEFVEMFLNEARLAAMLNHPNIVQIYDLGEVDNTYYIAMEYVDGYDLGQILDKSEELGGPVPPAYIARYLSQAAMGLHYAHSYTDPQTREPLGLVHRDVSLPNIMVSRDGIVKLLDFGIAKASAMKDQREATQTGVLKGKISYMSPEYLRGEKIDGRHDLFALGVLMYEMATGQKPFQAKGDVQMLQAILTQPPRDPYAFNPSLPNRLVEIIMRLLAKDPADRMQTGAEIQAALESFLYETGQQDVTQAHLATYMDELFGDGPRAPEAGSPRVSSPSRASNNYVPPPTPAPRPPSGGYHMPHNPTPSPGVHGGTSDLSAFQSMPSPSQTPAPSSTPTWMVEETKALSLDDVPLQNGQLVLPQGATEALNQPQFGETLEPQQALMAQGQPTPHQPPPSTPQVQLGFSNEASLPPPSPTPAPAPASPPPPMQDFVAATSEDKSSSKSIVWIIVVCFLLGGSAAGAWWFKNKRDKQNQSPNTTTQKRVKKYAKRKARKLLKRFTKRLRRKVRIRKRPKVRVVRSRKLRKPVVVAKRIKPPVRRGPVGLYLYSKPRCVVYWRGQMLGRTPRFLKIPPGQHLLMLRRLRPYVRYVFKVNVPKNKFKKQFVTIREGLLMVRSKFTAKLYIDGNYYGQISRPRSIRLYAGYHKVEARTNNPRARRRVYRRSINIRGGGRFKLKLKF